MCEEHYLLHAHLRHCYKTAQSLKYAKKQRQERKEKGRKGDIKGKRKKEKAGEKEGGEKPVCVSLSTSQTYSSMELFSKSLKNSIPKNTLDKH